MKHLGSALLLGIMLAMVLVLAVWFRPTIRGQVGKAPFAQRLNQLDQIEDPSDR